MTITQAELKEWLSYNPETGHFTWIKPYKKRSVGKQAGNLNKRLGYVQIRLHKKLYYAHRLAWLYMTGEWPKDEVDHRMGNRADNRWSELRAATHAQNGSNLSTSGRGKNKYKGVHVAQGKYIQARIMKHGKFHYLGTFQTEEEAAEAYRKAAKEMFGEFARTD